jgi:hypothetical protein
MRRHPLHDVGGMVGLEEPKPQPPSGDGHRTQDESLLFGAKLEKEFVGFRALEALKSADPLVQGENGPGVAKLFGGEALFGHGSEHRTSLTIPHTLWDQSP